MTVDSVAAARLASAGVKDLPDDWCVRELGGLLAEERGLSVGVMYPGENDPAGTPLVKAGDLARNVLNGQLGFKISLLKHKEYRRTALEGGELLMTLVGEVGLCAVVPAEAAGWNAARSVAVMRFSEQGDAEYVRLCLMSRPLRHLMDAWSNTTVQATLNLREVRELPLPWPRETVRHGIAAIGKALDSKIRSSRRLIVLIVNLIEAEVAAATRSAVSAPVSSLARFVNGGAYTKGASGTGRMVLRIAELNSGPGASTVYTELDVPDDKTARAGDLLMSWSGSLDIYRWTRDEAIINQHIFKVIPKDLPAWLVHDRLKAVMPIFQSIAKDKATTMGHIQRGHLDSTTVPVPRSEHIKRLDAELGPLWDRLLLAERQIHTLAALREALLPELLSGRIRVPEAGEAVEAALA